jgi:hypothetical protein
MVAASRISGLREDIIRLSVRRGSLIREGATRAKVDGAERALEAKIDELCSLATRAAENAERLGGVLHLIGGGDSPCRDEAKLRQWAYQALTLGRSAEELSS